MPEKYLTSFMNQLLEFRSLQIRCPHPHAFIQSPNILHWKPAKKKQIGCGLEVKFGPNYVQCCEKIKETCNNIIRFFYVLLGDYILKQ